MRRISFALLVAVLVLGGWLTNRLAYNYFVIEEAEQAHGRLSLYRNSITAALERYAPLAYVLARDPVAVEAAQSGDMSVLNPRLREFSQSSGAEAIFLLGLDGVTVASANFDRPESFVGQDYSFRPYFRDALAGQAGRFYGIGSTTGTPGYFLSELIADARGQPLGVITVKISFAELENSWQTAQEPVFLANSDGVILLASDPDWRYHSLAPLTGEQRARIAADQQFRDEPLLALSVDKGLNLTDEDAPLHLVSKDLPHGWSLHYIPNDDRATNRALLFTAMVVGLVGLLAYVALFRRARRIRAALGRSEREEAQLRQANEALAVEIAERQRAEDQLRHAQTELEQTSRLAALGQLAASVTHELGQPIAAMRNHLAAAEFRPPDLGEFTHRLNGLVDRMEGITRQLKFFATPDMDPFETVDLRDVLAGSLALLHHNIAAQGAELTMSQDDRPMELRGSRLRLEQVITNLLRNALDACEDCDPPKIQIELGQSAHSIWIEIRDNGHGLGEASLEQLSQPFMTTRASGQGMGLGLAISANIVRDHGGEMRLRPSDSGGAVFRVSFPKPQSKDLAE